MKHKFKKSEYDKRKIDHFGYEAGEYHNGPICVRCGVGFCMHCHPERMNETCGKKAKSKSGHDDKKLDPMMVMMGKAFRF